MGYDLTFVRVRPNHWGGLTSPAHGEVIGRAHFSSFTRFVQKASYGAEWSDCITYDVGGEEMIGAADTDDFGGWYQANWARGLQRARELLAKAQVEKESHRRSYDTRADVLPALVAALEACVASTDPCYVSLSW